MPKRLQTKRCLSGCDARLQGKVEQRGMSACVVTQGIHRLPVRRTASDLSNVDSRTVGEIDTGDTSKRFSLIIPYCSEVGVRLLPIVKREAKANTIVCRVGEVSGSKASGQQAEPNSLAHDYHRGKLMQMLPNCVG